jgi:hypothetical protein
LYSKNEYTFFVFIQGFNCEESFLIALQNSKGISNDEWAEFNGKVSHLKAIACCHWEKLQFLNTKSHNVWTYCTIKTMADTMECIQIWYKRESMSAGRDIEVGISFGKGNIGYVLIKPLVFS